MVEIFFNLVFFYEYIKKEKYLVVLILCLVNIIFYIIDYYVMINVVLLIFVNKVINFNIEFYCNISIYF